jgi:hypothetical protein
MRVRSRLALRVTVVGLTLGAVAVPLAATQAHAATPTATASVSTNLVNNQVIKISGSGFPAKDSLYLVECSGVPDKTGAQCDTSALGNATTNASGAFTNAPFKVVAGAVGNGFCPTKTPGQCLLTVTDQKNTAVIPLGFAPFVQVKPTTGVKNGATVAFSGWGFADSVPFAAVQCAARSLAACDSANFVTGKTTATGGVSGSLTKVHLGKVGTATVKPGGASFIAVSTSLDPNTPPPAGTYGFGAFKFYKAPVATKLALTAKAHGKKVLVGGVITAGGKGAAGLKVTVFERTKGKHHWKAVKATVSKKGGKFAIAKLKRLGHAEQYRAVHTTQTLAGTVYSASASKIVTVKK